jgi:hypothetical protein
MATTVDSYAPFDSGAGANVTEGTWRNFMGYMTGRGDLANGVIRGVGLDSIVYADSTGMNVKVRTGEYWIKGHWGQNATEKTLAIAAADPTNPRKDRVVVRADFTNNRLELDVLTGTPAASPSAPTVTQTTSVWETSLAVVDVPATDLTIDATQVRDSRKFVDHIDPMVFLLSDITRNNTVSLADVADLLLIGSAGGKYNFEAFLEYDSSTVADAKFGISAPTGTTGRIAERSVTLATASTTGDFDFSTQALNTGISVGGAGAGTKICCRFSGWVQFPDESDSGSVMYVKVQFAQNTAEVSNTVLYTGSWIQMTRDRSQ